MSDNADHNVFIARKFDPKSLLSLARIELGDNARVAPIIRQITLLHSLRETPCNNFFRIVESANRQQPTNPSNRAYDHSKTHLIPSIPLFETIKLCPP